MKRTILQSTILLAAMLATFASCQYKDFDDYAGTLNVRVVADYSHSGCDTLPAITRVIFYSLDNQGGPYIYDVKNTADVSLPDGRFKVFAYNNDSEINRTRAYAYSDNTPVIYTDKADYRGIWKTDSIDTSVYYDFPDKTYTYYGDAAVTGVPEETRPEDNTIVCDMRKITRDVVIEVHGIRNTQYINSLRMSIDGIQREYSPVSSFNSSYVSVVGDGSVGNDGILKSDMNIFGFANQPHRLLVFLDGGNFHKILGFDVTEQMNKQTDGTDTLRIIVNTNYDVKDDVPVSNGFNVHVDDWDDEVVPIDMQ